jgi:altronate dehydratase
MKNEHEIRLTINIPQLADLTKLFTNQFSQINLKLNQIMADIDQVIADIAEEKTQIASLSVLTASLKQQVADALSGVTLPPAVQAKIDAAFAGVEANKQAVVDAINENTPQQP